MSNNNIFLTISTIVVVSVIAYLIFSTRGFTPKDISGSLVNGVNKPQKVLDDTLITEGKDEETLEEDSSFQLMLKDENFRKLIESPEFKELSKSPEFIDLMKNDKFWETTSDNKFEETEK